jgi:hypothetical protein
MSYLSEELINKIMLYVSHPCADMINNCKVTRFDNVKRMQTSTKQIPNTKCHTPSIFELRDDTTNKVEQWYEADVVERTIYNKFQIRCITEYKLKQFKHINYFILLHLHFNREIIDGFIVSEHNDCSDSDADGVIGFTSDDEHDYLARY